MEEEPIHRTFGSTVQRVSRDRVADAREMHADLVRPAGTDSDLQVRVSLEPFEDGPPGPSRSTVTSSCRHAYSPDRVSLDGCFDPSRVCPGDTLDEREVGFRHLTRSELRRERLMRCVVARDHNNAAGFAVETMDDAGPVIAADIRELAEAMQKRVHQRSRVLSRAGVHRHPCGFIHRDQIVIDIEDVERQVFRFRAQRRKRLWDDGDLLSSAQGK